MWLANTHYLDQQIHTGGEGMEPFLQMLDPTGKKRDGEVYREFEDYFLYSQVKAQQDNTHDEKVIKNTILIKYVSSIVQAMGYYPSNQEIDDMINEIKYDRFNTSLGQEVEGVGLDELIRSNFN